MHEAAVGEYRRVDAAAANAAANAAAAAADVVVLRWNAVFAFHQTEQVGHCTHHKYHSDSTDH